MMKPKNANFVQLHIEKVVLGLAAVVAIGVLLLYVLGNPWAVEVRGQEVPPGEVPEMIADAAQRLRGDLSNTESGFGRRPIPQYTGDFVDRTRLPSVGTGQFAAVNWRGLDAKMVSPEGVEPYDLPTPPVPSEVVAHAGYGVLDTTGDVQLDRQLAQLVNITGEPADFRYVTVGAHFDMEEWRQRLADDSGNPIPPHLWNAATYVAGVYLQRRELVDPLRGTWSDPQIVAKLPTARAFEPNFVREDYTTDQADVDLTYVRQNQEQIARAPFVPLGPQVPYRSPFAKRMTEAERVEYNKLNSRIQQLERQIQTLQDNLARQMERQNRQRPEAERRVAPRDPFGEPPMEDMMGERMPRNAARGGQDDQLSSRLARLQADLADLMAQRQALLGEELGQLTRPAAQQPGMEPWGEMPPPGYEDMMFDPQTGEPLNMPMDPRLNPRDRGLRPDMAGAGMGAVEPQDPRIRVWAHDLTVEPGKTYQYRIIVSVLNPLFRQTRVNPQQRAANYNRLTLGPSPQELSASPWSNEVTVDKALYFFVTSADATRQSADVEVWRLYDGKWRKGQFVVEPGDPIGGTATVTTRSGREVTLPMLVDGMAVDMVSTAGGGMSDTAFYYVDPDADNLLTRSVQQDQNDPDRIRLQNEAAIADQIAGSGEARVSSR